jgi:uncharacterized ferritin-like protein (DUF455 family)
MNTINEYCKFILLSSTLENKLLPPPEDLVDIKDLEIKIPNTPTRELKIAISEKKSKIPRLEHLHLPINRGIALHHFANHELMATEIFAWALLKFQNIPDKSRQDLFCSLQEEQKHLKLYLERMQELGIEFGERPLNGIFWKYIPLMPSFEKFSAIMSLSFEGANLDYATIYKKTFEQYEDEKTAEIMEIVFLDELKHVKRGLKVLQRRENQSISEWDYFLSLLDHPFTPRRAKGYFYIPDTRRKVGFTEEFILKLAEYKDEFSNRKKEIIPEGLKTWGIYTD